MNLGISAQPLLEIYNAYQHIKGSEMSYSVCQWLKA